MPSNPSNRTLALDLAVSWANQAGVHSGNAKSSDVVEAATMFAAFLDGDSAPDSPPTLEELLEAPRFGDPEWEQRLHLAFMTKVATAAGLVSGVRCKAVHHVGEYERCILEGLHGSRITWVESELINAMDAAPGVWEIPRSNVRFAFEVTDYDDRLRAMPSRALKLVADAVTQIDTQIDETITSLLTAATPPGADGDLVEITLALFDPWRSKMELDESGEERHFAGEIAYGAAAVTR